MTNIRRKWNLLSAAKRKSSIDKIIAFFEEENDENIGLISAENILDFFLDDIGDDIYNKAIEDSKATLKNHFDDLEVYLDLLKKQ